MIKHIYVKNYALIRELRLDLQPGFTTITGETGAGKSILLGALGLVLGNRADSKVLADASSKCVVEATFSVATLGLQSFFREHDLDYEPNTILRREILPSGKSRGFVNDTPVKLEQLKALGDRLIDIHSQHDSMLMMNPAFQLQMLDVLAANETNLLEYQTAYAKYRKLLTEKEELEKSLSIERDTDYIRFLVDELEKSQLKAGEEERLEAELNQLQHAEEIQRNFGSALRHLQDEFGVLDRIHEALKAMQAVSAYMPEAADLTNRLQSVEIELRDITNEAEAAVANVILDEASLHETEARFNLLQHLMQKHHVTNSEALLAKFDDLAAQLRLATQGAKALEEKNLEISRQFVVLKELAGRLHEVRIKRAKALEQETAAYLRELQLPHASLTIRILLTEKPGLQGFDDVVFLFAANPGSIPQAINKVASGGELSRVMLALKAILAQTKSLPAIIFDEIDAGISGETARRAAQILREMGAKMQVIAITHLPQIAASGSQQYQVRKEVSQNQTQTFIEPLTKSDRVEAIARLLSGAQVSDAARRTAEELLTN